MEGHKFIGEEGRWEIEVTWDSLLGTFTAVVWDTATTAETPEYWAGSFMGEVGSVEELAATIGSYGPIPDDVLDALRNEHAHRPPPVALQRLIRRRA